MPYDNRNPNFRNPNKKSAPIKLTSMTDIHRTRAMMRSGQLSDSEYNECGAAIQDLIDEARD